MEKYVSDKIRMISFFLILLVLYIHSGFHTEEIQGMKVNFYVQMILGDMIGRCAVPMFYVISGFLFFLSTTINIESIFIKMQKRFKSLVIPYIIGCVFVVLFLYILLQIQGISHFINGNISLIFKKDMLTLLYNTFVNSGSGTPIAFHLWFLRDLILLVFLAPLWFFLYKWFNWFWVGLIGLLAIYLSEGSFAYSLFWFSLGGAIHLIKFNIEETTTSLNKKVTIFLFILLCLLELFTFKWHGWYFLKVPIIFLGLLAIWFAYDFVFSKHFRIKNYRYLFYITSCTFFIYLFHMPTLNIVRKLIVYFLGKNSIGFLISYILSPWLFVGCVTIISLFFKKYFFNFYKIIVGGRV
ncbi:acyltransferase [Polaribacter vadi]|uniref:acyltransferase family protein n=1 Tax=Polaribacter TaxID=52959 RepID=UPI001C09EEAA|nr:MULTISPECIES: acyltransferase family protein [Polaribacter]MBU3010329.1 acyltransferase [Polaribacter vadi]MDO6740136.1 acyltransferase family protein [Polaribacter sp. 1_MG-2023]